MDILSQEEIDALLEVIDEEDTVPNDIDEDLYMFDEKQVTLYDFKRPSVVSREQIRSIRQLHDEMANKLKDNISFFLNKKIDVCLHSVDQMTYAEFLMSLPYNTSFNIFALNDSDDKKGVIELNHSIVFPLIDRMLGGVGDSFKTNRKFTELELKLISKVLEKIVDAIEKSWEKVAPMKISIIEQKTESSHDFVVEQNEIVIMVIMEIIIGEVSGMVNLCYPYIYFKEYFEKLNNSIKRRNAVNDKFLALLKENVNMKVEMGFETKKELESVLKLKKGDTIYFDSNLFMFMNNGKNKRKLKNIKYDKGEQKWI